MSDWILKTLDNHQSKQIIDLILPIQQIEFNVPVTLEAQPDLLDIETYYFRDGGCFWGMFDQDQLIGTIALLNIGHKAGAIRKMFVRKEYRGKELGIGQRLLDELLSFCRANNMADIYLGTVGQLKAAMRFYEKNGFTPIPQEALPEYFPRMKADHIFYHLQLSNTTAK